MTRLNHLTDEALEILQDRMIMESQKVRKELGFSYQTSTTKIRHAIDLIQSLRDEGEAMPLDIDMIRYRDDVRLIYKDVPIGVIKGEIDRALAMKLNRSYN